MQRIHAEKGHRRLTDPFELVPEPTTHCCNALLGTAVTSHGNKKTDRKRGTETEGENTHFKLFKPFNIHNKTDHGDSHKV